MFVRFLLLLLTKFRYWISNTQIPVVSSCLKTFPMVSLSQRWKSFSPNLELSPVWLCAVAKRWVVYFCYVIYLQTGRSKAIAFVEFLDAVVADIVAETMNDYIMFKRMLKVSVVPPEKVTNRLFLHTKVRNYHHSNQSAHMKVCWTVLFSFSSLEHRDMYERSWKRKRRTETPLRSWELSMISRVLYVFFWLFLLTSRRLRWKCQSLLVNKQCLFGLLLHTSEFY